MRYCKSGINIDALYTVFFNWFELYLIKFLIFDLTVKIFDVENSEVCDNQ